MNEHEHTKEPWAVGHNDTIINPDKEPIFLAISSALPGARPRVVACVNACVGIPTDVVEQATVNGKVALECWTDLAARLARADALIRQLLEGGSHDGPCDPPDAYGGCRIHLRLVRERELAACAYLEEGEAQP